MHNPATNSKLNTFKFYRPSFVCCEKWLDILLTHIEFEIPLPEEINFYIEPKPLRLNSNAFKKNLLANQQKKKLETTV